MNNDYENSVFTFLKKISKDYQKLLLVLLTRSYPSLKEEIEKHKLSNLCCIDVLSSHYGKKRQSKNCLYVQSPNVDEISQAISSIVQTKGCNVIIFDDISRLLHYQPIIEINRLTNTLKSLENIAKVKKIYLMNKDEELVQEESKRLFSDLKLYVDDILKLKEHS